MSFYFVAVAGVRTGRGSTPKSTSVAAREGVSLFCHTGFCQVAKRFERSETL
jgi:hypothetical protein